MFFKKKFLYLFLCFFICHNCFGVILVNPAKIKQFLEWHGRHNKIELEEALAMMGYSERDPWSLEDMFEKAQDESSGVTFRDIVDRIKEVFNKVAEQNRDEYESVLLNTMSIQDIEAFINDVLKVRKAPWSQYRDFKYPGQVDIHLGFASRNTAITKKYTDIQNGYELVKKLGSLVASYFDPQYMVQRILKIKDEGPDETFDQEPELLVLVDKRKNGTTGILGFPGYKQDKLHKKDHLFEAIQRANMGKNKDRWKLGSLEKAFFIFSAVATGIGFGLHQLQSYYVLDSANNRNAVAICGEKEFEAEGCYDKLGMEYYKRGLFSGLNIFAKEPKYPFFKQLHENYRALSKTEHPDAKCKGLTGAKREMCAEKAVAKTQEINHCYELINKKNRF